MPYNHLTLEEREKIYALKMTGLSFREIGTALNRSHSTITREYHRNSKYFTEYIPCKAQRRTDRQAKRQRMKAPLKDLDTFIYVRIKLREGWSPEMIAGRIRLDIPGSTIHHETIYRYIYGRGRTFKLWQHLPNQRKKRRRRVDRKAQKKHKSHRIPGARSIENRPPTIDLRGQVGHFETDLMEGSRKDKEVLTVEVDRKTRYSLLTKLANKKAVSKTEALVTKFSQLQRLSRSRYPLVRSITADNGSENAYHKDIEESLGVKVYFCHAYHSWEKGTVENMIGRIRRYIPKGEDLSKYTDKYIQLLENQLNNTPRKCLNYLTPNEAMEIEANKHKFRSFKSTLF